MDGDQIGSLIYLVLLGTAVLGWMLMQGRDGLGRMTQQMAIWGLIFLGAIAAVGLWQDIRHTTLALPDVQDGRIEIPRQADGHYHLGMLINGAPVNFVVDTGATNIVLTREDAARVGIDPDDLQYLGQARTANGVVATARVTLEEVRIGPIVDHNLRAFVSDGAQDGSLLGMDYLSRFTEVAIRGDRMVLSR